MRNGYEEKKSDGRNACFVFCTMLPVMCGGGSGYTDAAFEDDGGEKRGFCE